MRVLEFLLVASALLSSMLVQSQDLSECGRTSGDKSDKPNPGDYPYFCTLFVNANNQRIFIGGATLLNTQVLLTLGTLMTNLNLLQDDTNKCSKPRYSLSARCGSTHTKLDVGGEDRIVDRIVLHPEHNNQTLTHDYAMLVLKEPFTYSKDIGRVCKPDGPLDEDFDIDSFDSCIVLGHGDIGIDFTSYSDELKKGLLNLVPRSSCENRLNNEHFKTVGINNWKLHSTHVCAEGGENDTCKGDGGGPILCRYAVTNTNRNLEKYIQVGITAWGAKPCKDNFNNLPGVYSRLSRVTDWLNRADECNPETSSDDYDIKGVDADDFGLRQTKDEICDCMNQSV